MGDRTNNNPIQDILDELNRICTRKRELIVQLSAILRTGAGNDPAPPRVRLRLQLDPPNPHPRRRF